MPAEQSSSVKACMNAGLLLKQFAVLLMAVALVDAGRCEPPAKPAEIEYAVKAAYIYRFLFFSDWPESAFDGPDAYLKLCVLGRQPSSKVFQSVEGNHVYGHPLQVHWYPIRSSAAQFRSCHLLFINSKSKSHVKSVLAAVRGVPVLTIGEVRDFVDWGGMVNFVRVGDVIRFEINSAAAGEVDIRFRSQMLRVATRIVGSTSEE